MSYMFNRLYLKNVPSETTKNQLKEVFFSDLENIEIHFPKNKTNVPSDKKVAFIQFATENEGKLARKIINTTEWKDVQANFAIRPIAPESNSLKNGTEIARKSGQLSGGVRVCEYCGDSDSNYLCTECSTPSNKTYYCTEDHQIKDWKRHRLECKPLPKLSMITAKENDHSKVLIETQVQTTSISENEEEENDSEEDGGKNKPVGKFTFNVRSIDCPMDRGTNFFITHVATNRIIFVLPVKESRAYEDLLQDVAKVSHKAAKLTEMPGVQDYVLAPFNNSYHRARVQDTFETDSNGCNVRVFFIDFGNEKNLKWTTLRRLNYKLRGRNTYIFKVILENVIPGNTNEQVIKYLKGIYERKEELELFSMKKYLNERKAIFLVGGKPLNECVNELIHQAQPNASRNSEKSFYNNASIPIISRTSSVKLAIVDSSQLEEKSVLACMPFELLEDYRKLMQNIQDFCNSPFTPYRPELNEIFLAKHNNEWHRAISKPINEDKKNVILIDRMIDVSIDAQNFRKIPSLFGKPLFTTLCFVEGLNSADKKNLIDASSAIFNVIFDEATKCVVLKKP